MKSQTSTSVPTSGCMDLSDPSTNEQSYEHRGFYQRYQLCLRKHNIYDSFKSFQKLKTKMPIQFDKFDQQKLTDSKSHLESMAAKGQAKFYEIYVDALKVVQRPTIRRSLKVMNYMTADTNQIKVVVYSSGPITKKRSICFCNESTAIPFDMGLNGIAFHGFTTSELKSIKGTKGQESFG